VADAFDEVEESLREERMVKLFRRAAPFAIAVFVAVVAGVGGFEAWKAWRADQSATFVAEMAAAAKRAEAQDNTAAAEAYGALGAKGPQAHRALAEMERAAALVASDDLAGARAAFDAAAGLAKDPVLKDAALLRAAYLSADLDDFKTFRPRVDALIESGGLIQFPARELLAMEAMDEGDVETARAQFEFLTASLEAPQGVKQRAEIALAFLPPRPADPPAPAAPAPKTQ
jgi:hypothetical protein